MCFFLLLRVSRVCFVFVLVGYVYRLVLGGLLGLGLSSIAVVLLNVVGLPRVADPLVTDGESGEVAALGDDVLGESTLLGLVLVLMMARTLESVLLGYFLVHGKRGVNLRGGRK